MSNNRETDGISKNSPGLRTIFHPRLLNLKHIKNIVE